MFGDRSTETVLLGANLGRHCNQWGLYSIRVGFCSDAALFPNYIGQTCCNMVMSGSGVNSSLISTTNWFPSVR